MINLFFSSQHGQQHPPLAPEVAPEDDLPEGAIAMHGDDNEDNVEALPEVDPLLRPANRAGRLRRNNIRLWLNEQNNEIN